MVFYATVHTLSPIAKMGKLNKLFNRYTFTTIEPFESYKLIFFKICQKVMIVIGVNIFVHNYRMDKTTYFNLVSIIVYLVLSLYSIFFYDFISALKTLSCMGISVQVNK